MGPEALTAEEDSGAVILEAVGAVDTASGTPEVDTGKGCFSKSIILEVVMVDLL
jgi:hypothetical protein